MKLSILIVSYNVRDLLDRCLRSLERVPDDWEVIVVDNDSRDGTKELLTRYDVRCTNLKVVCLTQNVGFARGNIEAFKYASGGYILLLNPDTKVLPNAIETLMQYLDSHHDTSVVGSRLLNEDGSVQRSVRGFPTLMSQILVLLKLHNYFSDKFQSLNSYLLPDFDYSTSKEVDQVMGAVLMTRRSIIEKIGFLDPTFKRIFEEVDFCFRVKQAGGKIAYVSESRVVHSKGASFGNNQTMWKMLVKQYYFNQGLLRFFWKHKPFWQTLILYPSLIISLCIVVLLWLLLKFRVPFIKNKEW